MIDCNVNKMLTVLTVALFGGCGNIDSGVVTKKEHKGAWVQTTMIPSGKALIPLLTTHPEQYVIHISNNNHYGKCYVTESHYRTISIGDYVDCTK